MTITQMLRVQKAPDYLAWESNSGPPAVKGIVGILFCYHPQRSQIKAQLGSIASTKIKLMDLLYNII